MGEKKPRPSIRIQLLVGFIAFFSYAYFYNGNNVIQLARVLPVFSFVEPGSAATGTFRIDQFLGEDGTYTCDSSFYEGHYYSNKAPGSILLGVPVYLVFFHAERILGLDPAGEALRRVNAYILNLFLSALLVAFGIVCFYRVLLASQTSIPQAVSLSLLLALGTLLFPYSTQLWGHPSAAAFVIIALFFLLKRGSPNLAAGGLCVGLAVLTDYLAFLSLVIFTVYVILVHRKGLVWFAAGGILPALLFGVYHRYCFGSVFTLATTYTQTSWREAGKAFGMFGFPDPAVLLMILFSVKRGILLAMPVLVVSVFGFVRWARAWRTDALFWIAAAHVVFLLLINAAFVGWHSGWSAASRYQILALPFWIIALKELAPTHMQKAVLGLLGAISFLNMLALAVVSPFIPFKVEDPIYGFSHALFWKGQFAVKGMGEILEKASGGYDDFLVEAPWNWGMWLGLQSWASLLPWMAVLGGLLWLLRRAVRSEDS